VGRLFQGLRRTRSSRESPICADRRCNTTAKPTGRADLEETSSPVAVLADMEVQINVRMRFRHDITLIYEAPNRTKSNRWSTPQEIYDEVDS